MKPTKTRRQMHSELQEQIDEFLTRGGAVEQIPRGISGRPYADTPLPNIFENYSSTGVKHEDRTPIPEVVAAIENRKHPKAPLKPIKSKPRKKVILDDFGQPLRWEWVEE